MEDTFSDIFQYSSVYDDGFLVRLFIKMSEILVFPIYNTSSVFNKILSQVSSIFVDEAKDKF
jgi:hypothetical protein